MINIVSQEKGLMDSKVRLQNPYYNPYKNYDAYDFVDLEACDMTLPEEKII